MNFSFYADEKDGFNSALPIGNGHLGAMVYGNPFQERLVLNENTFWLGKKKDNRHQPNFYRSYRKVQSLLLEGKTDQAEQLAEDCLFPNPSGGAVYTTAGNLWISMEEEPVLNYQRTLNLEDGLVEVCFQTETAKYQRTYLASNPRDLLMIRCQGPQSQKLRINFRLDGYPNESHFSSDEILFQTFYNQNNLLITRIKVEAPFVTSCEDGLIAEGENIIIYVSMSTDVFSSTCLEDTAQRLVGLDFNQVLEEAVEDYRHLYRRQSFTSSDKEMEYLYNFSRYLMISCSRDHLPANLQGLWNQDQYPRWDSKFTLNINLEMNYFNVMASNLQECLMPVIHLLEKMYPNGKKLAKELYHARGYVCHHNTDLYGDCSMFDHYFPATIWPLGAAWLSLYVYEYYEYTLDLDFLRQYGYLLREAAYFILDILVTDRQGFYVICPSLSPENSYFLKGKKHQLSVGCTFDDELITALFQKAIQVAVLLNDVTKEEEKMSQVLKKLHPFTENRNGCLREWHQDYEEADPGHRHLSHLFGIYPEEIKIPEDLAVRTIDFRLKNGGGYTGWSRAWIVALYARLKEGRKAYEHFRLFLKNSISPVGLDLHPPFQIDGNFGIAAGIKELFFHSSMGRLELLPAFPQELTDVTLTGFRLKGNLILNMEIRKGVLSSLEIVALRKQPYVLVYKGIERSIILSEGTNKIRMTEV